MPSDESWNHNEEQENCEREDDEQVRIEAYEGVYTEKRYRMCRFPPSEESDEPVLEDEDYSDSIRY